MDNQSQHDKVEVMYTQSLEERFMNELQGVSKATVEELCKTHKKRKSEFGESTKALTQRVDDFWEAHVLPLYSVKEHKDTGDMLDAGKTTNGRKEGNEHKTENESVFLCSHGGTLLALTRSLATKFHFKLSADLLMMNRASPNTGVTILDTKSMSFEQYADISHLEQLGEAETKREEKMEVVDV